MQTMGVDPRDETWELVDPRYRVYFRAGTACDEWEVSGADVREVLAWAEANRGDRTYTLYACVPQDRLGLIRLAGADPTVVRSG
jgi:hypothetical protein